jgi:hypothetical protein
LPHPPGAYGAALAQSESPDFINYPNIVAIAGDAPISRMGDVGRSDRTAPPALQGVMIMNTLSLAKVAAALAIAGMLMAPAASFAGTPFIFGGPGYQPAVHAGTTASAMHAYAEAHEGVARGGWRATRPATNCMVSPGSTAFEPCFGR